MALKGFYREVWKDETLRENKVTQTEVIMIVDAVGRTIKRLLKDNGIFKWRDHFTLKTTNIKGGRQHRSKMVKNIPLRTLKEFILNLQKI